jgi:hypothetical protein
LVTKYFSITGGRKMKTEELLLYLYRDVGLYWEKELSLSVNRERISLRSNAQLKQFFRSNEVVYNITNSKDISKQEFEMNVFYMTETGSTRVGSLLKHIRNSIMHGNYEFKSDHGQVELVLKDFNRGKTTMMGSINWDKLIQLINCTR